MAESLPHIDQVKRLAAELDKRITRHSILEPYYVGECPLPDAIVTAGLTRAFRMLMPVAEAPWGSLVVDSKLDRLEVAGIRDVNQEVADKVWGAWQDNAMDSESKLGHAAALLDGRCFATVWPTADKQPDIALDDMTQMVVEYAEGSRRIRTGALRRWQEGNRVYATLYRPEGIYKFQGPEDSATDKSIESWERRQVKGERWPLENPLKVVPVVEIAVNRRLKPGRFAHARGEFEHATGLIDRINLLTFLGLVVAFWMGFPMRGVIGEKLNRVALVDDAGEPLIDEDTGKQKTRTVPPIEMKPDSFAQFENPQAKIFEWQAADRKNLSIFDELAQFAAVCKTPRHYFPLPGALSNIAADTIRADEGAMHAAVTGHKASMGEGWEEVGRLCGIILNVKLSARAEMLWKDHESRSLAERADAFTKLGSVEGFPWQAAAEKALSVSSDEINRWQSFESSSALATLMRAATSTPTAPPANGLPAG